MRSIVLIVVFLIMTFLFARFDKSQAPVHNRTSLEFSSTDDGAKVSGLKITQEKMGGPFTIELSQFETVWRNFKSYKGSTPEELDIENLSFKNFGKTLASKMNNLNFEVDFKNCQISDQNSKLFNCGYHKGMDKVLSKTVINGIEIGLIAIKSRVLIDKSIDASGGSIAKEKFAVDVAFTRSGRNYHFRVKTPGHNISTNATDSGTGPSSNLLEF